MKWIKITDEVPKEHEPIFVITRFGSHIGAYYDRGIFIDSVRGEPLLMIVEYWMYVPEPPKEKDNDA